MLWIASKCENLFQFVCVSIYAIKVQSTIFVEHENGDWQNNGRIKWNSGRVDHILISFIIIRYGIHWIHETNNFTWAYIDAPKVSIDLELIN